MTKTLEVEVFSDFICPWCYIGKERLYKITQQLQNEINIKLISRPYVLYPQIPEGGIEKSMFAKKTKPGMGRSLRKEAQIEGLDLNYHLIKRIPNSAQAHRLITMINDPVQKYKLALDIIRAYFQNGQDIEDLNFLSSLIQNETLAEAITQELFNPTDSTDRLQQEVTIATESFITIVPTLRINGSIIIPGLQSAEIWTRYLQRASVMKS